MPPYNDGSEALIVSSSSSFNSDVEQMDTSDNQNADESSAAENAMAEGGEDFTENSKTRVSTGVAVD